LAEEKESETTTKFPLSIEFPLKSEHEAFS